MNGFRLRGSSRWILWVEIGVILAVLSGIGIARFSRLTPPERLAIQLEAGLQQLYEMEIDHLARHGRYFPPEDPVYRAYMPWMERYEFDARHDGRRGFSVVLRADLDGDGEPGVWRIDQSSPEVQRIQED